MKFWITCTGLMSLLALGACSTYKPMTEAEMAAVEEIDYSRLPASQCDKSSYQVCKEARRNDVAQQYMLDHNGGFWRKINGTNCKITEGVEDFKISQHPNDVAVLYFKKDGDLYLMNKDHEIRRKGECPSSRGNLKMLMPDVAKYTVTSNVHTTVVNAAVSIHGDFKAWDNVKVVYADSYVEEFQMNQCFGSKGSFNSYVLFTRDRSDKVSKVKVEGTYYLKDNSKTTQKPYAKISQFINQEKVCR